MGFLDFLDLFIQYPLNVTFQIFIACQTSVLEIPFEEKNIFYLEEKYTMSNNIFDYFFVSKIEP